MGKLDDVVPVETSKPSFRSEAHPDPERASLRDIIEKHADDILPEAEESSDNIAHEPQARRGRDERGRFAGKKGEEPSGEEPAAPAAQKPKSPKQISEALVSGEDKTTEPQAEPAQADPSQSAPDLAPPGWAADAKPLWNQVPPRARQEIVKRETDLRRGMQQATDKAAQVQKDYADIDEALTPFREVIDSGRATRAQILKNFAWHQQRMDNPETRAQAFREMAASYGTSLSELEQQAAAQPQEPSYVREIRQTQQQLMQRFQQQEQQAQQGQQQATLAEIQAFATEKDASGNALRPHFEHLVDEIHLLLPGLKATNPGASPKQLLQAAYEKAVWANPATRELEMRKAAPPPVDTKRLEQARRASKMVNGEALGGETEDTPRDLRAHIRRNAAKLGM